MKRFLIFVTATLALCNSALAQNREVFVTFSPATLKSDVTSTTASLAASATPGIPGAGGTSVATSTSYSYPTFTAGYNQSFAMTSDVTVPISLVVGGKIALGWDSDNGCSSSYGRLQVPVSIRYDISAMKDFMVQPYFGLNASYFLFGSSKVSGTSVSWFSDKDSSRFNVGWQVGIDFVYKNYVIGIGYENDLTSFTNKVVSTEDAAAQTVTNVQTKENWSQFDIKIGYRF